MKVRVTGIDTLSPKLQREVKRLARAEVFRQRRIVDADYDTMVLYVLHERFGFGPGRLRKFYDAFVEVFDELLKNYEYENTEGEMIHDDTAIYAARQSLLAIGVDVLEWNDNLPRRKD